jgi:hypothetical protein
MRRRDRVSGVVGPGAKPCEGRACHPADYKPRFRFEQDNVGNSGILSAADRHKSRRGLERRSPFRAPAIANSAEVEDRAGARRSRINPPWTSRARGRTSVAIPLQPRRSQLPPLSKTPSARAGIASKNAAVRKTRPQVEARAPPSGRQAASGPVSRDLIARDPVWFKYWDGDRLARRGVPALRPGAGSCPRPAIWRPVGYRSAAFRS